MGLIKREHFPVPRGHREAYVAPPAGEHAALVGRNRRLVAAYGFRLAGLPFAEVRAVARAELVEIARRWTGRWGIALAAWAEPAPLVLTGHQPQPFHPGVWFKNFLAGDLARAVGGAALNLIVDNDECRGMAVRLPTRGAPGDGEVRAAEVPLADAAGGIPFEEQPASALRREALREVVGAAPSADVAEAFRQAWAILQEAARDAASLGEAVAAARRRMEARQGLANLELPVSAMADSNAFRRFVAATLERPEAFFAAYNDSLHEYRRAYDEENAAQPMPDLASEGRRLEMPYWVWRGGQRRRRLWVEPAAGGGLVLAADREAIGRLGPAEADRPEAAAAHLAALRRSGWKVRPRALAMTLFARLLVADAFVHGLGGALYDRITDAIVERLFGVRSPEMVVASCTVHLPLEVYPATRADLERARRLVRDWRYNPDRLIPEPVRRRPDAQTLVEEKRRLIRTRGATRGARHAAWRRIRDINAALAALCPESAPEAASRLARLQQELKWNAILRGREYPYLLYSPADLAAFYRETTQAYERRGDEQHAAAAGRAARRADEGCLIERRAAARRDHPQAPNPPLPKGPDR
jgi:hypothetical protein